MSFVVVIPLMDHSDHLATSVNACEPWRRHVANVPAKQHAYLMGLQHRRTGAGAGDKYWWPEKGSQLYFYQNEAGASRWPVTEPVVDELIADFNPELYDGGGGGGGGDEDGNGEDGYDEVYDEENLYYEGGYDEEADVGAIDDDDLDLEEMMNIAIS